MRPEVLENFPSAPSPTLATNESIESLYRQDAYHSLSIEGYEVTQELIQKIKEGEWHPKGEDRKQVDAMAAKGYFSSFQKVQLSISNF